MKRQFLIACTFIFAVTTGLLQADSNPTMSRVYGAQFTPQVADTQSAATVGTLDTTFDGDGSLSVNAALAGGQAVGIQALANGSFLTVLSLGSDSVVAQYNAEGVIASTGVYGTSGIATLGAGVTDTARASMLDTQGRLLVAGGAASGNAGWIARVSTDGDTVTTFTTGAAWQFVGGLAQQSITTNAGKIIAVGFNGAGTRAQIGRYKLDGTLDTTTFGASGLIVFDGTNGLTSTSGLYNVVVDSSDNIYVAYLDGTSAKVAKFTPNGALDATFDGAAAGNGIVPITYLNSATASQMRMAIDVANDLVIGAQVISTTAINVTSITSASGVAGTLADFTTSVFYELQSLVATSDGKVLLVGSDTVTPNMAVMRLTSAGVLDTTFNPSLGYKLFQIAGGTITASSLQAAAIAVDGQIYAAGYQTVDTPVTTPYVSRLNNTQYVSAVAQYPLAQEQGILDQTFGTPSRQTNSGVTTPFNGLYGSSMMQRAKAAVEVTAGDVTLGDIVVGMNGFTNTSNLSTMMLSWLTAEGAVATSQANIPTSGFLTLQNVTNSNETLNAMLQDGNGHIYIAGTSDSTTIGTSSLLGGAFVRAYSDFTSSTPAQATTAVGGVGAQGVGLSLQGIAQASESRTILGVVNAGGTTVGSIYAFNASGALDTTFGDAGSGSIATDSYGLNMGPSYSFVVSTTGTEPFIYAAYLDTTTLGVCVAKFQENGSGLIPEFGTITGVVTPGIVNKIFDGSTVAANNIRIGLLDNNNLVVAAVTTTGILVQFLNPVTGAIVLGAALNVPITGSTSLQLSRVTGVSDGTIMLTFWDNAGAGDDTMYIARVKADKLGLDLTFNSQGSQPGLLPIQIGNEVANYNARTATTAIIQSYYSGSGINYQGNIALVGFESVTANDATPMAMRVYGTPGTTEVIDFPLDVVEPGTFNTAYDLQSLLGFGFGKVIFTYPTGNVNAGKMLVGIDTGTTVQTTIIARVDASDLSLDTTTFGSGAGYVTIANNNGVNHVSIDKQNNILVGGQKVGASSLGWATAISDDGTTQTQFTMPTSPATIAAVNNIGQQESGRYIVAATETGGNGMLIAFQDKVVSGSTLAVDPTFNPLGFGSATAGSFYLASTDGLYAMAINTGYNASPLCNIDTIVVAYSVSNVANIAEVTADGSGFAIIAFATGATGNPVAADSSAVVQVNIDGSNNIVVGASRNNGATHQVQVRRYDSAGGTTTPFTGAGVSGGVQTLAFTGSSSVTLTGLMETTSQQTVLTGYNTPTTANGDLFAARLVANGALDTIWNTSPAGSDYAGLLTYNSTGTPTPGAINVTGSAIALTGNVYSIGSTTGTATTSDAIVSVVNGTTLVTQVSQNPLEKAAGTLDNTIPGAAGTALPLAGLVTGVPQKIYIYNTTVNSSPNGAMLIASVAATRYAYVTQLNADLSLNSSNFGTAGVVTLDLGAGNAVTITDMYVATANTNSAQQYIYVAGYKTNTGVNTAFIAIILPSGSGSPTIISSISALTATTVSPVSGGIRQSSNDRVLVSGYNGTSGAVVAYNSVTNAIDTSFGNNGNVSPKYGTGYYLTGVNNPVVAMTTDNSDRIYIAYKSSATTINVQRLLENGTELDVAFNNTGTVTLSGTTFSATQIKLAIDLVNSQIIVAAQDTTSNYIQLARFNFDGTSAGTLLNTITVGSALNLSDLFIDNSTLYSAYPNIYVVGYTGGGNSVVARVKSTSSTVIALDTVYASTGSPSGIANLSETPMTVVTAGALDEDRRVYMVGSNGSTLGYMGRFFGDYYWTERYPAITQGVVGALDLTLNPNGGADKGGVNLSDVAVTSTDWNTALANGYKARAIIENPNGDGSSYIAFSNNDKLLVGQVDADMVPVPGSVFGTNGLTTADVDMATVNTMAIDAAGRIIVAGTDSGANAQKVVSFTTAGALNATFANATVASTVGTTVAQQKSGRYIVGGYKSSVTATGIVSAYRNESAISALSLSVDPTFGPAANAGYYPTGVDSQVDDLVIDSNDYIYIVYRAGHTGSDVVYVAKLTPEGALVTSANTPSAQQWTGANPIATGITATQPARIAINQAGNILVGASTSTGVTTQLYNGSTGVAIGGAVAQPLSNSPVLTKLVGSITAQNEFYGAMYNTAPAASVFAITSAGALDNGFGTSGLTTTTTQSVVQITGLSVQYDGKLAAVGYNNAGTGPSADPVLIRFYGYPYMSQFAQAPDQVAAGILDTTLWPTSGALELDNYSPLSATITTLGGSSVSRIYEYAAGGANNGKALLVFSGTGAGNNYSVLARVNKDLTLDTSSLNGNIPFNGSNGFVTIGELLTHANNASALFVDSHFNIYVAGTTGGASWIRVYNNAGVLQSGWSTATSLTAAYQIGTQSNYRIILAGNNSNGTLYGYTTAGVLDNTFGAGGIVDMGTPSPITDITVDASDNIITVQTASNSTVLNRVSASGLTVTALSTANGTPITTANGNAKVVLDTAGSIIVASATTAGFTLARYLNDGTGTVKGSQVSFAIGGGTSVLGNIYATSDGKITLVGYETSGNNVVVARLISSPDGVSNTDLALDTLTFNSAATTGVSGIMETAIGTGAFLALDGIISADDRIMIAGSQGGQPYLARVFGDNYVTYVSQGQPLGVPGTINASFGNTTPTTGTYDDATLNALLVGAQGKAILPLANGGYYQAFDKAVPVTGTGTHSILIKTLASGALDTMYNPGISPIVPGIAGTTGDYAPLGVNSILQDGSGNVLLVGTDSGAGWLQRYTSAGVLDSGFGTRAAGTVATVAVEQTLARYVVAGANGSGAALFAYESLAPNGTPGTVDTTFNAGAGGTPGYVQIGSTNTIYNLVADQYDRLIFAVLNSTTGNTVDLYRLTPTGELDVTFGTNGVVSAIASAANAASVRVALDAAGNIIVAANSSTANTFSVRAYDNGISTSAGVNGVAIYNQLDVSSLTHSPSVTALVTDADGYAFVLGTQSGTNTAWIARIKSDGTLDTAGFDPNGAIPGIFQYTTGGGDVAHVYNALAVNVNATLGMFGYETSTGPVYTPTLVSVYNDPETSQESQSPNSKAVGTIDLTLGVGSSLAVTDGIRYYAGTGAAASGQVAQAVALYDDNNIVVAIDGSSTSSSGYSSIMINMFDNDGLLNPNFETAGTAIVLPNTASYAYQNQYVRDMVTFTAGGVTKAILAGYVYNSALPSNQQYSSLLLQYNLVPSGTSALDATFGGFNGSPQGIAFGDGKQAFVVGQQSTGRIVVGGLSQDNLGLLLGYTAGGKLDTSFGNDGYQSTNTGSTGIYSHAIDSQNRVVIAYNDGGTVNVARFLADGSAPDSTFNASASYIAGVTSNSNIKIAVDSSNNVYVAAGVTGNSISVSSYSNIDGLEIDTVTIAGSDLGNASAVYTLAKTIVDASGKVIVVAYDSNAKTTLVMRLTNALALDTTTFNGTGYITYQVAGNTVTSQVATDAMVHPDGRIIVVGSEL